MALYLSEGWDMYSATSQITGTGRWQPLVGQSSLFAWSSNADITGGPALVISPSTGTTGTNYIQSIACQNLGSGGNPRMMAGFWFKASAPSTYQNNASFFTWVQPTGSIPAAWNLVLSSQGYMACTSNGTTPLVGQSIYNVMDNNWHWVDVNNFPQNGNGMILYIDGIFQFWNQTNNFNTAQSGVAFAGIPGVTLTIGDVVFYGDLNPVYPSNAQFPILQRIITTTRPTADSSVSFTQSSAAASNAALVSQAGLSTTGYVQSSGLGNRDLYTYGALGFTPPNILSGMETAYMENPTGGGILHNQIVLSGATLNSLSSVYTPGSPYVMQQPQNFDPVTSTTWTSSAFGLATWGIRVSTASS